jgi:hypothetical protein
MLYPEMGALERLHEGFAGPVALGAADGAKQAARFGAMSM